MTPLVLPVLTTEQDELLRERGIDPNQLRRRTEAALSRALLRWAEERYNPDQPRDEFGRWTSEGSVLPVKVHSIAQALRLIKEGRGIRFERPHQAVTLLRRLDQIAKEAKARGEKAPVYDLCNVSVPGTNLFCVDAETEILTMRGWQRYPDLIVGEAVLTLNHLTGDSEWAPLEAVNLFPNESRQMVSMEGKLHSSLTTLDHRWPIETWRKRKEPTRRWRRSEDLPSGRFGWDDEIPVAAACSNLPLTPRHSDALVELVAWAWTEGTVGGDALRLYQSHRIHPAKVRAIRRALIEYCGAARPSLAAIRPALVGARDGSVREPVAAWRETQNLQTGMTSFHLNGAAAAPILEQMESQKVVRADFIASLTAEQLALFLECSLEADGHREGSTWMFGQRVEARNRILEMACALLGRRTNTKARPEMRPERKPGSYQYTTSICSRRAAIAPRRLVAWGHFKIEVVEHRGIVWCPTTPNRTWLARRHGTVWFTGNCDRNMGIPRDHMPQLKGVPRPGSPADKLPKDAKGEVNIGDAFKDYLRAKGLEVVDSTEQASFLRASQRDLDGVKVGGMMVAMENGDYHPGPIFISNENYVIDGHHTWAASVGYALGPGADDLKIPVARVNLPALQTLNEAIHFADSMGIPQADLSGKQKRARAQAEAEMRRRQQESERRDYDEALHPRDESGRWTSGGGGDVAALRASSRALPRESGDRPGWKNMTFADYDLYMGGYCAIFAGALQQTYGANVGLNWGSDGGLDHAFAYDDQGNAWDAGGRGRVSDFEGLSAQTERDVSRGRLEELARDGKIWFDQRNVDRAIKIVTGKNRSTKSEADYSA